MEITGELLINKDIVGKLMKFKSENILIVDDTPANLKLLSQILSNNGYHIRVASNGSHALSSVALALPDLILLDVKMPGMNGYEVCEKLKGSEKTQDIPVIFISALDDLMDKLQGFRSGGVDYITKPFQVEEVLARVKTHLDLRNIQRQLQATNARMAHELHLAALMQANFIPQKMPVLSNWQFSAVLQPARETSGDFFDVFYLPDGKLAILIADVVDKGVAAALFMALSWSLIREMVLTNPFNPDLVFEKVNQRIISIIEGTEFVTVFFGVLDPKSGEMVYANAGHNPPILVRSNQNSTELLTRTGIPLGITDEYNWKLSKVQIDSDDVLVLYTDGITEACNDEGDFMDFEEFKVCIQHLSNKGAHEIMQEILNKTQKFLNEQPPQDDITLLVIKHAENII